MTDFIESVSKLPRILRGFQTPSPRYRNKSKPVVAQYVETAPITELKDEKGKVRKVQMNRAMRRAAARDRRSATRLVKDAAEETVNTLIGRHQRIGGR